MSGKVFKCSLCSKEFNSGFNLNVHIEREHEGVRDSRKKKFKCNLCSHEFSYESYLIYHMRIHTGERPFKCTIDGCEMAFKRERTLEDHIKFKHRDERPFKCDFPGCPHTAKTFAYLLSHKKLHSVQRPFACPNSGCGFRAKSKNCVNSHKKSVHSEFKGFACTKCDYKTVKSFNLKRHMRRHSSRRDFKCNHPKCTEYFKSSSALKAHFANRHGERNIPCGQPGCGRKLPNAQALWNHKRNAHAEKIHACPNLNCNYSTKLAFNLAKHMIVHGGRHEKISCSIKGCEYKGKNNRALEAHIRNHNTLIPCPVSGCGRYATTREALKDHVKLHNPSGRPFKCPLCFKYFPKLNQLQKHCVTHTNEKPYRCGHCVFAASFRATIKGHISRAHADLKFPFIKILPSKDRECIHCKVTLPFAKFILHSMAHVTPVVILKRLETMWA